MIHFNITGCTISACQSWRVGNTCVKHGMEIAKQIKYVKNMHDPVWCKMRKQADIFRTEEMLNG